MLEIFTEDSWIAATTGVKCFNYKSNCNLDDDGLKKAMQAAAADDDAFFYAKVPTDHLQQVSVLMKAGFFLVDTNVVLQRRFVPSGPPIQTDIEIIEAGLEHHSALQNIAAGCFRYSRFHQDPFFPELAANHLKRRWVENYCLGRRGTVLYAALLHGRPVGFLAVLESFGKDSVAVIDLMGVETAYQGRGVGRALVARFIEEWQGRADHLVVGTQITNRPSLALYLSFGFQIMNSAYVFHAHARKGLLIK